MKGACHGGLSSMLANAMSGQQAETILPFTRFLEPPILNLAFKQLQPGRRCLIVWNLKIIRVSNFQDAFEKFKGNLVHDRIAGDHRKSFLHIRPWIKLKIQNQLRSIRLHLGTEEFKL